MKNNIIELNDGQNYYVLEELIYNNKKYICASLCNDDMSELNEKELVVVEIRLVGDDLKIYDIEDDKESATITNLMLDKMKNN